jgi:hypothetical protein
MSTAAVSTSSLNQQLQGFFQTRNSDVQQLGQALSSGNLAQAQVAYNNITAVGQGGPFASGNSFRGSQREQDFTAIGQALQSGDLAGAQSAFAALKATAANQGPHTTTNDPTSAASTGPEIVLNLSNGTGSTNPEQITINIANSSSGGEQVSFSVGNQGSSSGAQQVTLNLGANSNEEIVLNLLGGPSSTGTAADGPSSSSASGGLSVSA